MFPDEQKTEPSIKTSVLKQAAKTFKYSAKQSVEILKSSKETKS